MLPMTGFEPRTCIGLSHNHCFKPFQLFIDHALPNFDLLQQLFSLEIGEVMTTQSLNLPFVIFALQSY